MKKKILKDKLNKYGTKISTKTFCIEVFGIISGIIITSFILKLNYRSLIVIFAIAIIIVPLIVLAWYRQIACAKKFSLLTDYLSNVIPIFMQKSKIRYTLGELSTITSDEMKDVIDKAIEYIDNTKDDPNLFENALKIIEKEFPNSRVKSIHKFLIQVENLNSTAYKDIASNLYVDVENWIKRTYTFRRELDNRRNKLLILCVLTLVMDIMFVYVYGTNDFFMGYTSNLFYQISTTLFVISIEIICFIILTKLTGEWLINDTIVDEDKLLKNKYQLYKKGYPKLSITEIIISMLFIALGIYVFINNQKYLGYVCIIFSIVLLSHKTRRFNSIKKSITKKMEIEFPVWLREVSLSLENLTVLNAIENTINIVSYPLRKEIRVFLKDANKDPLAIKPYNDFLMEYDLEDARSSMRVLYSINNVSKNDVKQRISSLIIRNQDMLAKSESLRNEDSIGLIEALGYLPTIIFSIQIVASMFIMFYYMLDRVGGEMLF